MSNVESKIPPAAPRNRPTPPGQVTAMSEAEKEQKRQEIIESAPLQTNPDEATNPAVKSAPWREGMNLPVEQLMQIPHKTTMNQPKELALRLAYLVNERNKTRGFSRKFTATDLINEAVEQYTRTELKKLGFNTKE
jgi:hypothetical protein